MGGDLRVGCAMRVFRIAVCVFRVFDEFSVAAGKRADLLSSKRNYTLACSRAKARVSSVTEYRNLRCRMPARESRRMPIVREEGSVDPVHIFSCFSVFLFCWVS